MILFFVSQNLRAQTITISGIVLESNTNLPVFGAIVKVGLAGTTTDLNGNFMLQIKVETDAKQLLQVSFVGYQTFEEEVDFGQRITVLLRPNNQLLNQVVVSAGRYEQSIKRSTVSTEVIKPYLIQNRLTTNMDKLLDQIPGVSVVDGQINIRSGSGWSYGAGSRVMVLLDDMPFLTGDAGQVKWNFVPIENVQQVEIIKGASSVLYGSSALNGIVHFRTQMATGKPITRINVFGGAYSEPERKSLLWSRQKYQKQYGFNAFHSFKKNNSQLAFSANYLRDEGYRMGETENRLRVNVNTRFKANANIYYGINLGVLVSDGSSFLLWESYDKGYTILDSQVTTSKSKNFYVDPFVSIITGAFKHSIRGRVMYIHNDISNSNPAIDQDNSSRNLYGEYQVQRYFTGQQLTITGGLVASSNLSNSPLYSGLQQSTNTAVFLQMDKQFFRKLFLNFGGRYEHFEMNGQAESKPVFRAGANIELGKATFLRASFGQGYRFPSIAEKYIQTSVGALNIFPNPALKSETGWNAEIGLKQGFSLGNIRGFADGAWFYTRYQNMIEFNFGVWKPFDIFNPLKSLGFKSLNIGETKISGFDISLNAEGKIGEVLLQTILGYTYTYPITMNPDFIIARDSAGNSYSYRNTRSDSTDVLKYRYRHLAKFDFQLSYRKWQLGSSLRYNSAMENIDNIFLTIVNGSQTARKNNANGNFILDLRLAYQINKMIKISVVANNLFNAEMMTRPGDLRPPRLILLQGGVTF